MWVADPTARAEDGQPGEGECLNSDVPHNGARHPPRGCPPAPGQCALTARKSARCGANAGSPRPHQPHPGNTGRGTLADRPKGRATGGGTAPDIRRPSQWWKANHPGTASHHPRGMQPPAGHASQRDSARPPHPYTRAHSTWVADSDSPPRGRAARGGRAPELRRFSQPRTAPPPGTPSCYPHSAQQRLPSTHAVGPLLGPYAHTNCAREPRTGPRNPGYPPKGTGGRGTDSA